MLRCRQHIACYLDGCFRPGLPGRVYLVVPPSPCDVNTVFEPRQALTFGQAILPFRPTV
jgi:hypothetical protein